LRQNINILGNGNVGGRGVLNVYIEGDAGTLFVEITVQFRQGVTFRTDNLKRLIIPFLWAIRNVNGDSSANDHYYSERGATNRRSYGDAFPRVDCLARFWCARVHLELSLFRPARNGLYHAAVFGRHPFDIPADAVFHYQPDGAGFECGNGRERGFRGRANGNTELRIFARHFGGPALPYTGWRASRFPLRWCPPHTLNVQQNRSNGWLNLIASNNPTSYNQNVKAIVKVKGGK
jgi:hypothetical protein